MVCMPVINVSAKQNKKIRNHGTVNSTIGMKINATIYASVIATNPAKLAGDVVG
jgi:hypothetical protein